MKRQYLLEEAKEKLGCIEWQKILGPVWKPKKTNLKNIYTMSVLEEQQQQNNNETVIFVGGGEGKVGMYRVVEDFGSSMETEKENQILEEVGLLEVLSGSYEIISLKADPVSNRLYIGLGNGMIQVWDIQTLQQIVLHQAHSLAIHDVDVCSDGQKVVTSSIDAWIKVWDIRSQQEAKPIAQRQVSAPVTCSKLDQQGNWVICGDEGRRLYHYSLLCDHVAQQTDLEFIPLDVCVQPSELLVVGTCSQLVRYNFLGSRLYDDNLKTQLAYSVDVDKSKKMIGVCGVRGMFDILSPSGTYYL
eukprot:TRINITY_DN8582_c0_g1_i13.p2 TRINITY_DN8582_c0_g1~~TRINITY_DN8582_c0_g1_i13.p2  ORF type:complete len:301 (+),score=45.53 TRINITY_DN8582_c0_g1_i13:385-1287(+)